MDKPQSTDLSNIVPALFGQGFEGHIVLWSGQTRKSQFFNSTKLPTLYEAVADRAKEEDLYLGIATQKEKWESNSRGSAETVLEVLFFFADIDFADEKSSKKKYPPNQTVALDILDSFPIQPTLVQHSGNGLHVIFKLTKPLVITSDEQLVLAKAASKMHQNSLQAHYKKHGFEIDSVGDLARVFRVPGSNNHKGKNTKPVEVLSFDPKQTFDPFSHKELTQQSKVSNDVKPPSTKTYPLGKHDRIAVQCPWYGFHTGAGSSQSDEPNWHAAASITACCKDGEHHFHTYSSQHSSYSRREANTKFKRAIQANKPRTCASIKGELGQEGFCDTCVHSGQISSPVVLGRVYDPGSLGPIPLGYNIQGLFVLLDQARQIIIALSSGQLLSSVHLIGLAPRWFWEQQFRTKKGFSANDAGEAIIEACRDEGAFDPTQTRGRGVWSENGNAVVNLGKSLPDALQYTYLCFSPLDVTDTSSFEVRRLLKLIESLPWRNSGDALLAFGWLAVAPICGALRWRPHCFVFGPPNAGKTTLHNIASNILDPLRVAADGQSTEAGIRQTLGPDAMPVIMDEFETDQRGSRLSSILRLARSASSADSPVLRGTPEGKAMQFSIKTMFFWSAVNTTGMSPADQTRIMLMELQAHDNDVEAGAVIAREAAYFTSQGPNWCGFMAGNVEFVLQAIELFVGAMPNIDSRLKVNISTVLAGAFVALERRVPTDREAQTWVAKIEESLNLHGQAHERDDAAECLDHLLSHSVTGQGVGAYPLGQWIQLERDNLQSGSQTNGVREGQRIVALQGIKIVLEGVNEGFILRNSAPSLDQLFANTRWARGAWKRALGQSEGVRPTSGPIRFSNASGKHRGVVLSFDLLPEYDDNPIIDGSI